VAPAASGRGSPLSERVFAESLQRAGTSAFLVVHHDRLVYQRYFGDADRETLRTTFSVAKSFVSTLVAFAIDEGLIDSVEDPVADYLPELAGRDPRFERIELRDLLAMSSGIRYWDWPPTPTP
jgi:CubicO group peptidase (beta-lactamase class C family)